MRRTKLQLPRDASLSSLPLALAVYFFCSPSAFAETQALDWQIPIARRAVLWLLYDDWGQDHRAYGFERIAETAPNRQKPEPLRNARVIHIDASGWGGRASFLYNASDKTVFAAKTGKASLGSLQKVRLSVQKEQAQYTTKIWWGNQLFFLKLRLARSGEAVVTEFTDHWITVGKRPN